MEMEDSNYKYTCMTIKMMRYILRTATWYEEFLSISRLQQKLHKPQRQLIYIAR